MQITTNLHEAHRRSMSDIISDNNVWKIAVAPYKALTKYAPPAFPIFPALVTAIAALEKKDFGIFKDYQSVWVPLSVVSEDCVQYRTQVTESVYRALVPIRMSRMLSDKIRFALQSHGISLLFFCNGNFMVGREKNIRA